MQFYTKTHQHYCGIDLHAKTMYVCIMNQSGDILVHRNIKTDQDRLLTLIASYRDALVVCVECIFTSATAPALLYLLRPCSRGTGLLTCVPKNSSRLCWATLYI